MVILIENERVANTLLYVCSYCLLLLLYNLGMGSLTFSLKMEFFFLSYLFVKTEFSADPIIVLHQLKSTGVNSKAVPFVKGLR